MTNFTFLTILIITRPARLSMKRNIAGLFIIMTVYNKPPLTFEDQVQLLISRGLDLTSEKDKKYTLKLLQRVSYYRLSAYFIPLQDPKALDHQACLPC